MAKAKKFVPQESIASFFTEMKPANPIMSSAEKTYFRSLKKRGYSEDQIKQGIIKAGYKVTDDFFAVKPRKKAAGDAPVAAVGGTAPKMQSPVLASHMQRPR